MRPSAVWGACALTVVVATPVRADDVHLDSRTSFQAYEVRSPGTAAMMARRRLVQNLGLTWMRTLGSQPRRRRPRLSAAVRLRLDQDFGDTCLVGRDLCVRATDASDPGVYQPLASDTELDAAEAWVRVSNLAWDGEAKAGRHMRFEPIGPLRIDGVSARIAPAPWVAAEAYGGALVRATSALGSGAFEPQGAIRLDLEDEERSRAPFVADPVTTWAVGGAVSVGRTRIVRGRLAFREIVEETGLVGRRAGIDVVSQPVDELHLLASGVWDPHDGEFVDAVGSVTADLVEPLTVAMTVERHVPRFDYGTIWAYFDLAPISEASVLTTWRPTGRLELGAGVRGRMASFDGTDEHDLGGEGSVRTRLGAFRLGASLFVWGGDLGPVAGVLLDAKRPIGARLRATARASAWHFDDPLRAGLHGTSLSDALGLELALSESTRVAFEAEHAHNRVVGHRFRALAVLTLEVWR